MSEHYDDGVRWYDGSSYEGPVPACGCGRVFESVDERKRHIRFQRRKEREERIAKATAWLDEHKSWCWLLVSLLAFLVGAFACGVLNVAEKIQ